MSNHGSLTPFGSSGGGVILVDEPTRIRPFDFSRQDTIERGRLRLLRPLLENLAGRMSSSLSSRIRQFVKVRVIDDSMQIAWEDYAASLPDPTFMATALIFPIDRRFVLHLPVSLALYLVDFSLGGDGLNQPQREDLTDIEHALLGPALEEIWHESVAPALTSTLELSAANCSTANSPILLQIGRSGEACLVVEMGLTLENTDEFPISLILPISGLRPIIESLERAQLGAAFEDYEPRRLDMEASLAGVVLDVKIGYPSISLTSTELLRVRRGDVIPVATRTEVGYDLLDLIVGDAVFARGALVADGRKQAVTVITIEEFDHD